MSKTHSPFLKFFIYLLVAMMLFSAIGVMVMYLNVPTQQNTPSEAVIPSDEPSIPAEEPTVPTEEPVINTGSDAEATNTGSVVETGSVTDTGTVVATGA